MNARITLTIESARVRIGEGNESGIRGWGGGGGGGVKEGSIS